MPLCLLALTLLMTRVFTDHHDAAVAADNAAFLADPLYTWTNLHGFPFFLYYLCTAYMRNKLLVSVRNTSTSQVVRAHFQHHTILWKDADIILAHLS